MKIANSAVLITGAHRGIGLAFANAFLERGARKVYAGARDPSKVGSFLADETMPQVKNGLSAERAVYLAAR